MGQQAGPARAAGRLAPPATGRGLGQRKVRVETRSGRVRTKKDAPTPPVELELGGGERLLDFVISADTWLPLTATLAERVAAEKRKTVDWDWEATVEVPLPPSKPRRRSTGNGNGSHRRGRKAGS